ncbi:hypothetical protein PYW08_012752 [Mythimna loreyi]|uniref:Uncharacterized protein n=1 Tax=Mythimna loreyi TaxID=667449 RepID=A0ACC2Q187_9NEOP|nr:hypothetical protein PYW08_012752 [Mythimna loreyi]
MYFIKLFLVTILVLFVAETVLALSCRECGGYPNAHIGCAGYCYNKCSDYQLNTPENRASCPPCELGWACNEGYVYDEQIKECVKPQDCTPEGIDVLAGPQGIETLAGPERTDII